MTTNKPLFRFNARAVESDPTGYYMTRWDRAQPVTVVAHTRDEAFKKVWAMMGEPPRHDVWLFQVCQDRDAHFGELMRAIGQVDALQAECEKLRTAAEVSAADANDAERGLETVKAECEKLRAAMIEAKGHISHYMYGGSSYRGPAAKAIALIDAALAAHRQGGEE